MRVGGAIAPGPSCRPRSHLINVPARLHVAKSTHTSISYYWLKVAVCVTNKRLPQVVNAMTNVGRTTMMT